MTSFKSVLPFVAAMAIVVTASNILLQYPFDHFGLSNLLTWGAFTYPVAFLINDLTNRRYGKSAARRVVFAGFLIAVALSIWLATPRIAIASGVAFLTGQMLDIQVFDRLRRQSWWKAPFMATIFGSVLDTAIFFSLAFAARFAFIDAAFGMADGSLAFPVPFFGGEASLWMALAFGDLCVKVLMGVLGADPLWRAFERLAPRARYCLTAASPGEDNMNSAFWLAFAAYLIPTFPLGYFWHLKTFASEYEKLNIYRAGCAHPDGPRLHDHSGPVLRLGLSAPVQHRAGALAVKRRQIRADFRRARMVVCGSSRRRQDTAWLRFRNSWRSKRLSRRFSSPSPPR